MFMVLVSVVGGVAAARYEMAIMLPASEQEAELLAWLSGGIATLFCLALFIPCLVWNESIGQAMGDQTLSRVLPWLPLAAWLLTLGAIFSALVSRKRHFSTVARANVLKALSMSGVQLGAGFTGFGVTGLIMGNLLGAMAFLAGLYRVARGNCRRGRFTFGQFSQLAFRYRDFPRYTLLATLANGISVNILSFLLSIFYSLTALGFYNLVQRVLAAPSAVLGNAVGQVFYQQASVELREKGSMWQSFRAAWLRLLVISILPFIIMYFFAEPLFAMIFGESWRIAGRYAEILAPMFWVRFWVSPLSSTNQILQNNSVGLVANLILLVLSVLIVVVSFWCSLTVEVMLAWMSGGLSIFYLIFFVVLYVSARKVRRVECF